MFSDLERFGDLQKFLLSASPLLSRLISNSALCHYSLLIDITLYRNRPGTGGCAMFENPKPHSRQLHEEIVSIQRQEIEGGETNFALAKHILLEGLSDSGSEYGGEGVWPR